MEEKIELDGFDNIESIFALFKDKDLDIELYQARLAFSIHGLTQYINLSEKGVKHLIDVLTQISPIMEKMNKERIIEVSDKLKEHLNKKDK